MTIYCPPVTPDPALTGHQRFDHQPEWPDSAPIDRHSRPVRRNAKGRKIKKKTRSVRQRGRWTPPRCEPRMSASQDANEDALDDRTVAKWIRVQTAKWKRGLTAQATRSTTPSLSNKLSHGATN